MEQNRSIPVPKKVYEYLWPRYLPETTYQMYVLIGYLQMENIRGKEATARILGADFKIEQAMPRLVEERKKLIEKLGYKYPETREDDLHLLLQYKLIKLGKDESGEMLYVYNIPVPRPQDVLPLDEEELQTLENVKFEMGHQDAMNAVFTLLLKHNGNFMTTLDNVYKTTKVKLPEIKAVLDYLVKEGSISVKANKPLQSLKKEDKLYIAINKEVFEEKRFVLE